MLECKVSVGDWMSKPSSSRNEELQFGNDGNEQN
jgi:hypothetical protein